MTVPLFLIIDGYPKKSRDEFDVAGMTHAWRLYSSMLHSVLPEAEYRVWLPSDEAELPEGLGVEQYTGILWTGCNLTVYQTDQPRVVRQLELARRGYESGTPAFGSCWGLQVAAAAAGGEVKAHPLGREMGFARRTKLTEAGCGHPMMKGKPDVFNAFISHDDEVTSLPPGSEVLASNDYTSIQATVITHRRGTFWATQYHPEYDLHEMARLIVAREERLVREGFFLDGRDLANYVEKLEALHREPERKDLRWQLDVGNEIISNELRQVEFRNWLDQLVLPSLTS